MRTQRRIYNARGLTKKQFFVLSGVLVIAFGAFLIGVQKDNQIEESGEDTPIITEAVMIEPEPTEGIKELEKVPTEQEVPVEQEVYGDPNNYVYPYNTMSADWGSELYESGFKYYQIPQKYIEEGGCFPEVVQAYLWCLCEERGIDYYTLVALIESESHYKYSARGDNGNSLGYMQIYKKWHEERMEAEGVDDLLDPYGNIRVGTNFFSEIQSKYLESSGIHCVLMVYNMGETGAKKCWREGIYSTEYSRKIVDRAQEIRQELQE